MPGPWEKYGIATPEQGWTPENWWKNLFETNPDTATPTTAPVTAGTTGNVQWNNPNASWMSPAQSIAALYKEILGRDPYPGEVDDYLASGKDLAQIRHEMTAWLAANPTAPPAIPVTTPPVSTTPVTTPPVPTAPPAITPPDLGAPPTIPASDAYIRQLYMLYEGRDPNDTEMGLWRGHDVLELENALRRGRGLTNLTTSTLGPEKDKWRYQLEYDIWKARQDYQKAIYDGDANRANAIKLQLDRLVADKARDDADRQLRGDTAVGIIGGVNTLERDKYLQDLRANPRNFVQSLMEGAQPGQTGRMTDQQTAAYLNASPMVSNLVGMRNATGTDAASTITAQAQNRQGLVPQNAGYRNADFPFISGRHINARDAIRMENERDPNRDIISSLASYSGQDPDAFWGENRAYRPRGQTAGPTRYR